MAYKNFDLKRFMPLFTQSSYGSKVHYKNMYSLKIFVANFRKKPRNLPIWILLIGLFKILNPDSAGLKPGQSC